MSFLFGHAKPPTPPDPAVTIAQQSQASQDAARQTAVLNNVNQQTPYGDVTYTQPYGTDQWLQTTTMSPSESALYHSQLAGETQATDTARNQLGRIGEVLKQGLTPGQMVMGVGNQSLRNQFDPGPALQTGFDQGPGVQGSFNTGLDLQTGWNPGQAVQGQVGPQNFNDAVNQARNAQYSQATSRLDPQWQQAAEQEQAQLVAQGLSPNSTAYQTQMANFGRAKNDAYNQANYSAVQAGDELQNQLFGQQVQQGQFANQAAGQQFGQGQQQEQAYNQAVGQQYGQALGAAQFANQAAGQQYSQNQGAAQFANQAAGQIYGQNQGAAAFYNQTENQDVQNQIATGTFTNEAQQQQLAQQAYVQNQPINQFSTLMSGGQVQGPQAMPYTPTQVQPTNVLGAYGLSSGIAEQNYQQQMQNQASMMNGLFSLGSAGIKAVSDRRLKRDVHRSGRRGKFKLYVYKLKGEGGWREGVMADEVRRLRPDCVHRSADGFDRVDYGRLAA